MEEFRLIKNNLMCGFISYSEFISQWEDVLREHGMAFGDGIRRNLDEINKEYCAKLHELADEILDKQGWLAK